MTARRHICDKTCQADGHTFRAAWPIDDDELTKSAAIALAEPTIPDLLFEAGAQLVGPVTWHLEIYGDVTWLCATAPAAPWIDDPASALRREAA